MLVVGGLVPLAWICVLMLQGIVVGLSKLSGEAFYIIAIMLAHVLILAPLLYAAAALISWMLFRLLAKRIAKIVVVVLIVAAAAASLFEIYRLPGHNSSPPANIIRLLERF